MKNILLKLMLVVLASTFGETIENPCRRDTSKPPTLEILADIKTDESVYQLASIIDSSQDYPFPKEDRSTVKIYHLHGNTRCPYKNNGARRQTKVELHHLPFYLTASTCPSRVVINYDENRVPVVLAETQCTCRVCGLTTRGRCKPIYYFRRVLRRTCDRKTGKYIYTRTTEPLQTGCTCIDKKRRKAMERQYLAKST